MPIPFLDCSTQVKIFSRGLFFREFFNLIFPLQKKLRKTLNRVGLIKWCFYTPRVKMNNPEKAETVFNIHRVKCNS